MVAGIVAAAVSTFDSMGSSLSALFTRDIYARLLVPNRDDAPAGCGDQPRRIAAHVAEALHAGRGVAGLEAELQQGLAQAVDYPVTGGLGADQATTVAQTFTRHRASELIAAALVLAEQVTDAD